MDEPTLFLTALRDVGLPATILLWFLLRTDKRLETVARAIDDLTVAVATHVSTQRANTRTHERS